MGEAESSRMNRSFSARWASISLIVAASSSGIDGLDEQALVSTTASTAATSFNRRFTILDSRFTVLKDITPAGGRDSRRRRRRPARFDRRALENPSKRGNQGPQGFPLTHPRQRRFRE